MNKQNDLHVCSTRRADGLTHRYCDVYKAPYRLNYLIPKVIKLFDSDENENKNSPIYVYPDNTTRSRGPDMENTRGDVRRCRSWTP